MQFVNWELQLARLAKNEKIARDLMILSKLLNFFFPKAKEIKLSVIVSNNNTFFFLHKVKYFYNELNVFTSREQRI